MSVPPVRRQSARNVRSSISRPQNYYARNLSNPVDATPTDVQSAFFPALTHFTDAIDTLPREIMRHFSMMKEVEAKLYGPDEDLSSLAEQIARLPPPSRRIPDSHQSAPSPETASTELPESQRFPLYRQLNNHLVQLAPLLDEKIAVLSTANIALAEQLDRIESSYVHIPDEVSDDARLGSSSHWAYTTEKETKKTGNERTRREVAAAGTYAGSAAAQDGDHAARSEARREAMLARKHRAHHQDSDFEERPLARKLKGKNARQVEAPAGPDARSFAMALPNGTTTGPSKRKKAAAVVPPLERSISGAVSGQKRPPGSPTPGTEGSRKRKNPPGPIPGKKRLQTADGKSPRPFSSPLLGTFNVKEPAQRGGHARARHGSQSNAAAQIPADSARARPASSAANIPAVEPIAPPPLTPVAAPMPEAPATIDAPATESVVTTSKAPVEEPSTMKREEMESTENVPIPEAPVHPVVTATARRASKATTPIVSTIPEPTVRAGSRTARTKEANGNGSHASSESGAGERQQTREKRKRIVSRKAENGDPGEHGEEEGENEEEEADGDEPRYCYCDEVSYGEMVACDNMGCARQWFHLRCAGLKEAPTTAKWYCEDCKASMKDSRRSRPASRREQA